MENFFSNAIASINNLKKAYFLMRFLLASFLNSN